MNWVDGHDQFIGKLLHMEKTYTIYATETAYYQIRVSANSKEEAIERVDSGEFSSWETIDGENFKINEVEED